MSNMQAAFEAWAKQQNPPYELHVRPLAQQRGPMNIYSNQRTQHAYEGFAGASNSHEQLVGALRNARVYLDANRLQGFTETSAEGGGVYEDDDGGLVRREAVQAIIEEFMVGVAAALAAAEA